MKNVLPLLLALVWLATSLRSPKDQDPQVGAVSLPPAPPLSAVPDRVQTYKVAWLNQSSNGVYQCETNWSIWTATNGGVIWAGNEGATNCVPPFTNFAPTINTLMLWSVTGSPVVYATNLGLVRTQYYTVLSNAPYLRVDPPPLPPTNFIFTIYGSINLTNWYVLTNLYVPNSKPFEFMKCGLTRVVPKWN